MSIPIKRLVVEGPDCAGKSTLIRNFHKKTKYKYNVHDRSFLSMVVYARMYDRKDDEAAHRAALMEELCDLNNLVVILVPPLQVLLDRFRQRGDDIQTLDSLVRLHSLFLEEAKKLEEFPNVVALFDSLPPDELVELLDFEVGAHANLPVNLVGEMVKDLVHASAKTELQVRVNVHVRPDYACWDAFRGTHEEGYFQDTAVDFFSKIGAEIRGENPYFAKQGLDSRRFYWSSDTCISSIHFLPREGGLKAVVTCRSTDVDRNAALDTMFLAHLAADAAREFGWNKQNKPIDLTINFNSAHIRTDLPSA